MNNNDYLFMRYIVEFNKEYDTVEEFNMRKANFVKAHEEIMELNNQNGSLSVRHNKFSDYTEKEYQKMLGLRNMALPNIQGVEQHEYSESNALPETVNWVTAGKVSPIQDQGQCGSCWAFSAAASLESAHAISSGDLLKISEQQFVDCSSAYGNQGCNGGWYMYAWSYAKKTSMDSEASYPYTSGRTQTAGTCNVDTSTQELKDISYKKVSANTTAIKTALAQQPCSVAINATSRAFSSYSSGVLSVAQCGGTQMDHAVVAVGYGTEAGTPYYLVRNSWGTSWGDAGYVKIAQADGKGACGINQMVYYPTA
jgi:cathepsin L